MTKCVFCKKPLGKQEIYHINSECNNIRSDILKYLNESDRITVGLGACGCAAGAKDTYDLLKNSNLNIPVDAVGCMGMCYNEPVVTVRQKGKYSIYRNMTKERAYQLIIALKDGNRHNDCFVADSRDAIDYYKKQKILVTENCGVIDPLAILQYVATGGFAGLVNAVKKTPAEVIEEIKKSGLRGRGGAGFSTGIKWGFLRSAEGPKYFVCNGDEGDPGAFMNRSLLEGDPLRVIEGMIIGCYATGAETAFMYTRAEYPLAVETIQKALDLCYFYGFLGKNILGIDGFNLDISIREGAGAFVCGEETALMQSVEGKRGQPMPRPPYPAEKGIYDHPTNINNVGTLGAVATIMKIGADNYAKLGTAKTKGTIILCLVGKIKKSGVVEVPIGISLKEVIYDIGGGILDDKQLKAVQSGGPAGGCIPASLIDTPIDYESIASIGAIMGSGGLIILDEDNCMVDTARYFLNFSTEESCGKCTPCREGTLRMFELVDRMTKGQAVESDFQKLEDLAHIIKDTSLCGLGQLAPTPVLTTMRYFKDEYMDHIINKKCKTHHCTGLMHYSITDSCIGCGACVRICPSGAITGKIKSKHIIDLAKCTKCGACIKTCQFKSISFS